ncbi:MAG: glycosyltransferase [Nanopusillaceae archaeon]
MYIREILMLFIIFVGLLFTYFNLFMIYFFKEIKKKKLDTYPKVSIIVPAYNEEKNIEETINSLLNLDYDKDKLEIIVVDDGSKDKTYEIARKYEGKNVKVLRKENGGKASALNYGLKHASGEFIVTMDADSIVPKDALKKMLEYFDEENVMVVVPSIQVKERKKFLEMIQSVEYSYNNFLRMIFDKLNSIYVAPGPFSIFRRKVFDIVGGFDEKNLTEDMEIAMRILSFGFKIRYCPEVVVKTKAPKGFVSLLKQRLRWYLGFIENFLVYRKKITDKIVINLVFSSAILFIILPILNLFLFLYDIIRSFYLQFLFYYHIDFNIKPIFEYSISNYHNIFGNLLVEYLSRGFFLLFYNIVLFLIFLFFILKSWKIEKERSKISLFIYSFVYIFMYSIFWIIAIYYKIFGRELKWGGVVWKNSLINKIKNGSK